MNKEPVNDRDRQALPESSDESSEQEREMSKEEARKKLSQHAESVVSDLPDCIGEYQVIRKLGHGAFSVVILAQHTSSKQRYALKIPYRLHPWQDDDGFAREADALSKLNHPGIARFHESRWIDGVWVMCMEWVDGKSLAWILEHESISTLQAIDTVIDLLEALGHAHSAGIIHRDIKPENILFNQAGRLKLVDFGLAKDDVSLGGSPIGQIKGSIAYMSPEQASGDVHRTDVRSDLFSVGIVLFELLAGQRPFTGKSDEEIRVAIIEADYVHLNELKPGLPHGLIDICDRALQKKQTDRFQTATEFAETLRAAKLLKDTSKPNLPQRLFTADHGAAGISIWNKWSMLYQVMMFFAALYFSIWAIGLFGSQPTTVTVPVRSLPLRKSIVNPPLSPLAVVRTVLIKSHPQGASLTLFPLNELRKPLIDKKIQWNGRSDLKLTSGEYLIVAQWPGGDFAEVYRYVPHNLDVIADQIRLDHHRWKIVDGRVLLPSIEIKSFDSTGMIDCGEFWIDAKPFDEKLAGPYFDGDRTNFNHHHATHWCEQRGKRLPTYAELEFASRHIDIDRSIRHWTGELTTMWSHHLMGFGVDEIVRTWPNSGDLHTGAVRIQNGLRFFGVRSKSPFNARAKIKSPDIFHP